MAAIKDMNYTPAPTNQGKLIELVLSNIIGAIITFKESKT